MTNTKGKAEAWMQAAKRNAVVAAVVLFVCLAVYLNWNYQNTGGTDVGKTLGDAALVGAEAGDPLISGNVGEQNGSEGGAAPSSGYFANARLNRQQARDSALSLLQEASAGGADQAMQEQTNAAIQTMADYTVTEAQIENLVIAKGYADCVAFIGEDTVSVVVQVPGGQLTDVDTARITDIATQSTDFEPSRIKIIAVE